MITGIIDNTDRSVLFTGDQDEFQFCFMTDSIHEMRKPIDAVVLPNNDGFVFGRTHDNHRVAIFVGDENIQVQTTLRLTTGAYVVSSGNVFPQDITEYSSISFVGGSLNNIFRADRIDFDPEKSVARLKDDTVFYAFDVADEKISIEIESGISISHEQAGNFIKNSEVTLTMKFEHPLKLKDVFKYYQVLKKTLSFMCFRKNVGFDKIQLNTSSKSIPGVIETIADFNINDDRNIALKPWQTNICISDLGDAFPKLVKLFFDESEKSEAPNIGFLPEDKKDVYRIYPIKVKEICLSLESEYKYVSDGKTNNDVLLKEIQKGVLEYLSNFKEQHTDFPDSSYSLLKSSVSNWSLSLRDRISYLCNYYSEELALANGSGIVIDENAIQALVKYRNAVTHSGYASLQSPITETAFYIQVVIYCSVLDRIGVPRETIKALCPHRLLK